jgi:hypothetical protein
MRAAADSEDFVTWMLRAIVDAMPGFPSNSIIRIEQRTRRHWGGLRPYIAKHPPGERLARANARNVPKVCGRPK